MADRKLDVRVYPLDDPKGNTKAFSSVAINDIVAIRGIRVVEDKKGLFVAMPQSYDKKTEKHYDIAFPSTGELRKDINRAILNEHNRLKDLDPAQRAYDSHEPIEPDAINVEDIKLDIRVYPIEDPQGSTKAFASISVDDLVTIRGVRVVEGNDGLFVAMPQSQDKYMNYHDVAFPLTAELRNEISAVVLEKLGVELSVEQKPSLVNKLAEGAQKATEHVTPQRPAAKSHTGVLE